MCYWFLIEYKRATDDRFFSITTRRLILYMYLYQQITTVNFPISAVGNCWRNVGISHHQCRVKEPISTHLWLEDGQSK